jgi:U3 small nucleolar ribonucleoprotein protein IMP3
MRQLAHRLANLDPSDAFRRKHEDLMLEKLFDLGVLGTGGGGRGKLSDVEHKLTVSAFARRRLPVIMTRLRMADTIQAATKMIEQGHVRVGTNVITDTAYLVTRGMEDFVTWVDSSKVKRNILKYRDKLDDFELEAL